MQLLQYVTFYLKWHRRTFDLFPDCKFCKNGQQAFLDLDLKKSLQFRVVVRQVDISKVKDLGEFKNIKYVPYITYRKPGETRFQEYTNYLTDIDKVFSRYLLLFFAVIYSSRPYYHPVKKNISYAFLAGFILLQ